MTERNLTPAARAKLSQLSQTADDAAAASTAAVRSFDKLDNERHRLLREIESLDPNEQPQRRTEHEQVLAELDATMQKQRMVLDVRQARTANERAVYQAMHTWAMQPGPALETVKHEAKPHKGKTLVQAIERVQDQIHHLKGEHWRVLRAPKPLAELRAQLRAKIEALAERGRPRLQGVNRIPANPYEPTGPCQPFELLFRAGSNAPVPGHGLTSDYYQPYGASIDAAALAAWLWKDELLARLEGELEAASDVAEGLGDEQRNRELKRLDAALLELERDEEALIVQAHETGLHIMRRRHANPLAVLSVKEVTARTRAAA